MYSYEVCQNVPTRFAEIVHASLRSPGLTLLSGGTTIRDLTGPLAKTLDNQPCNPDAVLGQVDERLVPLSDDSSNWHTITENLPADLVHGHPMFPIDSDLLALAKTESPPYSARVSEFGKRSAEAYAHWMRSVAPWSLIHLGLGTDGHTASLFPGSEALSDLSEDVATNFDVSGSNSHLRLTLTFRAILRFSQRVVVAVGPSKADIVAKVMTGEPLPISRLPEQGTLFLLDYESAARL